MLELFSFKGNEIRFVDGKPVANDVAQILGYADASATVSKKVNPKYKGVAKMETPGGIQSVTVLEEAGIYQLIFGSKLPIAEDFRDWVFQEVLPSIRKTGSYSINKVKDTGKEKFDTYCYVVDKVFENVCIHPSLIAGMKLSKAEEYLPQLGSLDESRNLLVSSSPSETLLTPTQLGGKLEMSGQKVNKLLIEKGLQVKNPNKKGQKDPSYIPTERGEEFCSFTLATGSGENSTTYQQLRWYESVLSVLS